MQLLLQSVAQLNIIKLANPFVQSFPASALPPYNTSKFLTDILSPIQNSNGHSVLDSLNFANEEAHMEISDDEVMLSFDVVSLLTAGSLSRKLALIFATNSITLR